MQKFGWPASLVAETAHWVILARPAQPTLGSLVLAAKSEALAFGDLDPRAHADLAIACKTIESALRAQVGYERINYLMLMMVDPHVHFHVVPRYSGERDWDGTVFEDAGWPGVPNLSAAIDLGEQLPAFVDWMRRAFEGSSEKS